MSDSENPEFAALRELESVVRHVSDELAAWRRRAQKAEGDRPGPRDPGPAVAPEAMAALEAENVEMTRRLEAARGRLQDLLKRLQFLEEQATVQELR